MSARVVTVRTSGGRGLTLIEMLAVIVIFSLVAGMVLVRLGPVHDDAALRSTASALIELDGRARLHTLRGGRVKMEADHERGVVRLIAFGSGELLSQEALPPGALLRITTADDEQAIAFDRTGRSPDYEAEILRNGRTIRWRVSGATGIVASKEYGP